MEKSDMNILSVILNALFFLKMHQKTRNGRVSLTQQRIFAPNILDSAIFNFH
jgi:hypothetical protein